MSSKTIGEPLFGLRTTMLYRNDMTGTVDKWEIVPLLATIDEAPSGKTFLATVGTNSIAFYGWGGWWYSVKQKCDGLDVYQTVCEESISNMQPHIVKTRTPVIRVVSTC